MRMEISRELFDQQRRPRFGLTNPERIHFAFWEWMIRGPGRRVIEEHGGPYAAQFALFRDGKCKSVDGPWRARDLFKIPLSREEGPIWTFDRMRRTCTDLPDGRQICIAGEHEDSYDPDFYIYNDVVVFGSNDPIEIYGYPREVFPPTDWHTATLVGDRIILVGCYGYPADRRPGYTPVYALDLSSYRISKIETGGEMPGWIFGHEADLTADSIITIRGGRVIEQRGDRRLDRRNVEDYVLDIRSSMWRRVTDRHWGQFWIRQEDRKRFRAEPKPEQLRPRGIAHAIVPCEDADRALIEVEGVPISLAVYGRWIEMVVQGELPGELSLRVAEEVRSATEASIGRRCILEQM
jgi:hypothetical protein